MSERVERRQRLSSRRTVSVVGRANDNDMAFFEANAQSETRAAASVDFLAAGADWQVRERRANLLHFDSREVRVVG